MTCRSCGSANQAEFPAEMIIHFDGVKNIDKPGSLYSRSCWCAWTVASWSR